MSDNYCSLFQAKAVGRVLFDQVCKQLHLLEADYFGLDYLDSSGTKVSERVLKKIRVIEKENNINII